MTNRKSKTWPTCLSSRRLTISTKDKKTQHNKPSKSTLSLGNYFSPKGRLIKKFLLNHYSDWTHFLRVDSNTVNWGKDQNHVLCYLGYVVLPNKAPLIEISLSYCIKLKKKVLKSLFNGVLSTLLNWGLRASVDLPIFFKYQSYLKAVPAILFYISFTID